MLSRYLVKTAKSPPICPGDTSQKMAKIGLFGFLFSQTAACLLAKYTKKTLFQILDKRRFSEYNSYKTVTMVTNRKTIKEILNGYVFEKVR